MSEILIPVTIWLNLENITLSKYKLITKNNILYGSIYIKCSEQANP